MSKYYSLEIEEEMGSFYKSLNEKDRRRFASLSAMQLSHGGTKYVSSILNVDPSTIYKGKKEILESNVCTDGIRKSGGGRKPIREKYPNIDEVFLQVLKNHTAGDPMNKKIIWTDLTKLEIVTLMESNDIKISKQVVSDLLKTHSYVKRKIQKKRK